MLMVTESNLLSWDGGIHMPHVNVLASLSEQATLTHHKPYCNPSSGSKENSFMHDCTEFLLPFNPECRRKILATF